MRLIHTSDWHLGQVFYSKNRKEEHQAFLEWLLQQAVLNQVDGVIVAGDIFDTGTPPSYARELYNRFVVDANRAAIPLIILGGNHDSVATLNESKQLVSRLGTHVVAGATTDLNQQLIGLHNRQGELSAIVCAVPFLRAKDLIESRAGESGIEKRRSLAEAIAQHYQQLYRLACEHRDSLNTDIPIIATGHMAALGVSKSDAVRDIYIGSIDGFDASGFPPADYIALGHIHRPQKVGGKENIRYSGSPIPLSFDELKTEKQVLLLEFEGACLTHIEPLLVPIVQPLMVLRGSLKSLEQQLAKLPKTEKPIWLSVEVEVDDLLVDLQQQVQLLVEELNVEVLQIKRSRTRQSRVLEQQEQETLSELTPQEVFSRRLALESFEDEAQQQRAKRISQQFEQILHQLETESEQ